MPFELLTYLAIGVFSGLLAGLFGVGGGAVIVPALIFVFTHVQLSSDWIPHIAVGTSLATIIGTGAASTLAHHRRDGVRWDLVLRLTPAIVLGAWAGAAIAPSIEDLWMKRLFALFLASIGLKMLLNRGGAQPNRPIPGSLGIWGAGGSIGLLSALLGIGGGSMTVPFLNRHGLPMRKAVGTSAACGLPIALAGTLGLIITGWGRDGLPAWSWGFVYWPAVAIMLIASVPSAPLGARLAHRLPTAMLRRIFGILLVLIATRLVFS